MDVSLALYLLGVYDLANHATIMKEYELVMRPRCIYKGYSRKSVLVRGQAALKAHLLE